MYGDEETQNCKGNIVSSEPSNDFVLCLKVVRLSYDHMQIFVSPVFSPWLCFIFPKIYRLNSFGKYIYLPQNSVIIFKTLFQLDK